MLVRKVCLTLDGLKFFGEGLFDVAIKKQFIFGYLVYIYKKKMIFSPVLCIENFSFKKSTKQA